MVLWFCAGRWEVEWDGGEVSTAVGLQGFKASQRNIACNAIRALSKFI